MDLLEDPRNYCFLKTKWVEKSAGICYFYHTLKSLTDQMSSFGENARKTISKISKIIH